MALPLLEFNEAEVNTLAGHSVQLKDGIIYGPETRTLGLRYVPPCPGPLGGACWVLERGQLLGEMEQSDYACQCSSVCSACICSLVLHH